MTGSASSPDPHNRRADGPRQITQTARRRNETLWLAVAAIATLALLAALTMFMDR